MLEFKIDKRKKYKGYIKLDNGKTQTDCLGFQNTSNGEYLLNLDITEDGTLRIWSNHYDLEQSGDVVFMRKKQ